MARLILDSGALIGWANQDEEVRGYIRRAIRGRDLIVVPAVVVAETTRGGPRDAPVNRVLKFVGEIAPTNEVKARVAGRLLAASGLSNATVDAMVVAEAVLGEPAIVLTGDVDDLSALAAGHSHVRVYGI